MQAMLAPLACSNIDIQLHVISAMLPSCSAAVVGGGAVVQQRHFHRPGSVHFAALDTPKSSQAVIQEMLQVRI